MKIVYFNYLYDLQESSVGAAVHFRELARALEEQGHDVRPYFLNQFTSVAASVKSPVRGFLKRKLWRYLNQVNALVSNFRYFKKEWRILSAEKPDVVLVRYNLLNFSFILAARLKKIPVVLEVNAPMAYESRQYASYAVRIPWLPEFIERKLLQWSDRVIVVSRELQQYYERWRIPAAKMIVVPNGVDERRFQPEGMSQEIRNRYALQQQVVVGFVGSFHFWHGLENLIHFIKLTLARFDGVKFLLVGEGPLKRELEQKVQQDELTDRVIFAGYVPHDQVPAYLSAMDIVLAPYPRLDFFYYSPLKLFEYLAAGKAVIASRIGQITEIIRDGVNGVLFDPDNFEDLQRQLFSLIENEAYRNQLGKNGRKSIIEHYTWRHTAQRILAVMAEMRMKDKQS